MKIAIASDHAGYLLKETLITYLRSLDYEVSDLGTNSPDKSVDYPDFAIKACVEVLTDRSERGIVVCGSGVGACVAANKIKGIRAGLCHDTYSAHQGVEHDNINVLCMGARVIGEALAFEIAATFAAAKFSGEERHRRRLTKINNLEKGIQC